jgi:hypothetical protein
MIRPAHRLGTSIITRAPGPPGLSLAESELGLRLTPGRAVIIGPADCAKGLFGSGRAPGPPQAGHRSSFSATQYHAPDRRRPDSY